MDEAARRVRAEARRRTATIVKTTLTAAEHDPTPFWGVEALSLVARLTREAWALSRRELPTYERGRIPWRFVPGPPT